jgi:hypothetical protein
MAIGVRHINRLRNCPACGKRKHSYYFRESRKNNAINKICLHCRQNSPKNLREKQKKERRKKSAFRHNFFKVYRFLKSRKKEVNTVARKQDVLGILKFPERVAAIVGKTYAVMGDDFKLADDEANMMIRDLLEEYDEGIIRRNKNKRLSKSGKD